MADAVCKYVEWHGGIHDDGCPQDDTCDCSAKPINDGVNAACRYLIKLARLRGEATVRVEGVDEGMTWQKIETAPRDSSHVLVAYKRWDGHWIVQEAWWRMPWENAPAEQCAWQTMSGMLLSADVHRSKDGKGIGATHWMPLPPAPSDVVRSGEDDGSAP